MTSKKVLTDLDLNCSVLVYNTNNQEFKYLIDFNDSNTIANLKLNFLLHQNQVYPSIRKNNKNISLVDFLYKNIINNFTINFLNNNIFDLRRENVKVFHFYHSVIINKYPEAIYIPGHYIEGGSDCNIMKNPMWKINPDSDQYLMFCEQDSLCYIDQQSLEKIQEFEKKNKNNNKKLTFYKHQNGYILCSAINLYIHQVIMDCYGNGSGTKNISVDHIDRDPLNNRFDNLRIASRIEQENNSKGIQEGTKRERKHNAQPLPEGITQDMLKKYVVYYRECYNKDKQLFREFFRVESHPKQTKEWIGTKSEKVTILDKLKAANLYVTQLNSDTLPEDTAPKLPLYINIQNFRQKPHLVFDRRLETGGRQNLKMVLPNDYNLEEQLTKFQAKIDQKYPPEVS